MLMGDGGLLFFSFAQMDGVALPFLLLAAFPRLPVVSRSHLVLSRSFQIGR